MGIEKVQDDYGFAGVDAHDQSHAEAIDLLRRSGQFFLIAIDKDQIVCSYSVSKSQQSSFEEVLSEITAGPLIPEDAG